MTNQPLNDPDYVPEKKFNPMLIIGFLNFHRRFIFGALLLAGVAWLLIQLNEQNKQSRIDAANAEDACQPGEPLSQTIAFDSSPQPTELLAPDVSQNPVIGRPVASAAPVEVERTVPQVISWLLRSTNNWRQKSPANAVAILQIRIKKIKGMLEDRELKPRQRTYCIQEYIKAVGWLSEQDVELVTGAEGIDEKIADVKQSYEASEDQDISALAKAVAVGHLVRRFTERQNDETFENFRVAYSDRRDAIDSSDNAKVHVTKAICDATAKAGDDSRFRQIASEYLMSVVYMDDINVVDLAKNLYFPEVDWKTLPDRIKNDSPSADADLKILLDRLQDYPDIPMVFYSTIGAAIQWRKDNGDDEKARQALIQLKAIAPKITLERTRQEVLRGIQLLSDDAPKVAE